MAHVNDSIKNIARQLTPVYPDIGVAQRIAQQLLSQLTNLTYTQLLTTTNLELSPQQLAMLHTWIHDIVHLHKPVQYILKSVPFGELQIQVKSPILIPRPETEEWVFKLTTTLQDTPLRILDMCTGTGCIGLMLAHTFQQAHVLLTDINEQACQLAQQNALSHNLTNTHIIQSDCFDHIPSTPEYDLITANPPYISAEEYTNLEPRVTQWEDKKALYAGNNGLALYEEIIYHAPDYLTIKGHLWLEIGHEQAPAVITLLRNAAFTHITPHKDMQGKQRAISARAPESSHP